MSDMERACHALEIADSSDWHDRQSKDYPAMVCAVLTALREPSEAMLNEGGVAMTKTWTDPWDELGLEMTDILALPDAPDTELLEACMHVAPHVKSTWQAMIDAVLTGAE